MPHESMAPERLFEPSLAPEAPVFPEEDANEHPTNIEEQAQILALATDGAKDKREEVAQANAVSIREGRVNDLRNDIVFQEYKSTAEVLRSQAETAAQLGQAEEVNKRLKQSLEMARISDEQRKQSPSSASIVVSSAALIKASQEDTFNREVNPAHIERNVEKYGELNGLRNALLSQLEKMESSPVKDIAAYYGSNFLPFAWAGYSKQFFNAAGKLVGKDVPYSPDPWKWIDAVRQRWASLDDDGKESMLRMIESEEFGLVWDNQSAKKQFMEMLATYTAADASSVGNWETLGLGADILFGLGAIMGRVARAGQPAKALAETAGRRVVGRSIGDALVLKETGKLGLNDAESVSHAIAAGRSPYIVDPAAFEGAAPHIQSRLAEHWERMMLAEEGRMSAAGVPQAERNARLEQIKNAYLSPERKDIYAVKFAGASDGDSIKMTVLMTDEDGLLFRTEEVARAFARRRGLADDAWRLTTPEAEAKIADDAVRANVRTFHGGDDFAEFRADFIGRGQGGDSLGHGFYTSIVKGMAERFARGRVAEGKAATLYELSLPDAKFFLDFNKSFSKQSDEVKRALSQTLTGEEIVALKDKTGREVYDVLKNRLGSTVKASSALEKAGISGNTGTTMGRDREVVVFSEDLMNRSLVRKTPVKGGETAVVKAARKEAELAQDEAALSLLEEFGAREGDALRMSIAIHKSFLAVTPEGLQRLNTVRAFDNPTVPLFGREMAPHQFSGAFNEDAVRYYSNFSKLLGMESERALFVTGEDVGTLMRRPEFQDPFSQSRLREFSGIITRQRGAYLPLRGRDGKYVHLVGVNESPHKIEGIRTGTHELGHMFDNVYFRNLHGEMRNTMFRDFTKWVDSTRGSALGASEMAERIMSPDMSAFSTYEVLNHAAAGFYANDPSALARIEGTKRWLSMFEEYIAEQMTKWATTDVRAIDVGERVFANWRDTLVKFYRRMTVMMKRLFDREVMINTPEQEFKELMDMHLARVNNMREQGLLNGDLDLASLDFTTAVRENIRGPMQPAGGRRAEPSFRGPMGVPKPVPAGGYLVKLNIDDPIKADGTYDATDIASMPWIAADPRHGVSVDAMMGRVMGVHQTAKMRRDMTNMLKPALSPLSKGQRERVLAVLEEGDQASFGGSYGKEFTAPELIAKGLVDKEMEAYFTVRQARMLNYFIHNKEMVNSMRRKGLMEIEVFGQGKFAGKPATIEAARTMNKQNVYDLSTKTFVELDADIAYAKGSRLVETASGTKIDGHEISRFLATEKEATARTIYTALHYRPGEFARIYSDNYFIRMATTRLVDGVKKGIEVPIRTAASEKEAKEFVEAVTTGKELVTKGASDAELDKVISKFYGVEDFKKQVLDGELKEMAGLRFHFTREIDDYLGQTIESHAHTGKLFTRDRGEHILTADRTRAARSNILNPYESLSREITMVSHFANVTEWKEAQIGRWINTFGDMLGSSRTGDDVRDFFAAAGAKFSHVVGKKGLFAERTHAYIMRQVGIQTQEHKWWQALMRRIGEGVMPYIGEGVGAVIRDANPLNFVRSINHHATLGLFNVSQLIVQANGMSIAAAIHPIHGFKAAALYPAIRIALMSDNPEVWARISKAAGEDVGKVAKAIRQSGLIDNLRSTSLHNIEDGKMDIFASMPRRALGSVIDKGAFFFNRGEEAARVISFDIARREWEKLNPGKDFLSKEGMQWIMRRSDDFTQNMTRANLARWQEGIMSIPTQFLQYNIKLLQNIASGLVSGGGRGRGFTRGEALKALAGSMAFYGAAGMGMSSIVGEWIPDEIEAKMPETMKTAIGQGVLAAAMKAVVEATTGERFEVALGQRLGSVNFFTDLVYDAYHDPKNIWEAMLGPTRSTGERLAVFADIVNLWRRQPTVTLDDVSKASLEFFTAQVSSTRNATKAYYIAQGNNVLKNRKGEAIAELSNPEIWAQAFGIAPSAAYDVYTLLDSRRAHFAALDDVAEMVMNTHKKILEARSRGDEAYAVRMEGALQFMYPQNYGDFVHVQKLVREKLAPFDTQFQKLLNEHALKASNFSKPFQTTTPEVKR